VLRAASIAASAALLAGILASPAGRPPVAVVAASASPAWPLDRLAIGLLDGEGGAADLARRGSVNARYQYLAGGVNTKNPWPAWGRGDGRFVSDYVAESREAGLLPVFTFYEIRQSLPGASERDEAKAVLDNLRNATTMRAYFENVRLLMQRLGAQDASAVVHVEPDLWGYAQQSRGDDPRATRAAISTSGVSELAGLPDDLAGFARAWERLRDRYAPNVVLGYALSIWGTNKDIAISNEPDAAVDHLAGRAARFARAAAPGFEVVFGEFNDRTSGYARARGAGPEAWWDAADFRRHARFLRTVNAQDRRAIVLWQIPLGNTVMRSMDNTPRHYQDNRVQWLLSPRGRYEHLRSYRAAGAVAVLFGSGQGDDTHASDAAGDGVTNPAPINGNRRRATNADDDGGYFHDRARAYQRAGPLRLR
jgi:hypothetical protein